MNGIAFAVSLVLFIGGIVLFGYAFEVVGWEAAMFVGGIAAIVISIMIPFHFLKNSQS